MPMFIVAGASLFAIMIGSAAGFLAPVLLYAGVKRLFGDLIEVY